MASKACSPRTIAFAILIASTPGCRESGHLPAPELLRAALVPFPLGTPLDHDLARAQQAVRTDAGSLVALERLGTLLIAKARATHDAGWFKLAEQVALAMEAREPENSSALLLRGHVLHSLHSFREAEAIARKLVTKRGLVHDHGLLGDVLYDEGRLVEAAQSYQKMLDLKPCLQSYTRAAQMRWIKGDLGGARELLTLATSAGSSKDLEAQAWTYARLATVAMQERDFAAAEDAIAIALRLQPEHAASLLAQSRLCSARGDRDGALRSAEAASRASAEVEPRWAMADCLRELGRESEALRVETELEATGASDDPRTFALYLATRGKDLARAAMLAEKELAVRQDPFTHDALALVALRSGDRDGATCSMRKALAAGTQDARILTHAALVASAVGDTALAAKHRERALALGATLLPSERGLLERVPTR